MNCKHTHVMALSLAAIISSASADITNQVEALVNPISKPDNSVIAAGEFRLRLGFFNFDASLPDNAAITANQGNLALLESHFVTFFDFNAAEQAEGDQGTTGELHGDAGAPNLAPGTTYAYLPLADGDYNANPAYAPFRGAAAAGDEPNFYGWFQLTADAGQQAIFTSSTRTFNPGNDPINNGSVLQIQEGASGLQVLVGNDRTATPSDDYQLVPEPSSVLLLAGGASLLIARRRRA